jgi:molecular chaperone GrpE
MDASISEQKLHASERPEDASGQSNLAEPSAEAGYEQKYKDLYDQYVRLAADFDNFRKRRQQEVEYSRKYGAESALLALLPALDNLERASASLNETSDPKMLYQSFRLVYNQLIGALDTIGVKKMNPVGQTFDPNLHEAIGQVPTADMPEESVVNEAQAGYLYHDRVLRPAMVTVAVAPSEPAPAQAVNNPFKAAFSADNSPEA